jgi:hypothetical protein
MQTNFDGLGMNLGSLPFLSSAISRSISAENPTGGKGLGGKATTGTGAIFARELGQGWKISPCISLAPSSTVALADIDGPGAIQHIWMTVDPQFWRRLVLRFYWDEEERPSVEVPMGDFFCNGWSVPANVNSLPVAVNPSGGLTAYWVMPFKKHARITIENLASNEVPGFYYQIDYTLTPVPPDLAYFHTQWRRSNPLPYLSPHVLLDDVQGPGHFVGTYIAWEARRNGWWGEGEVKFYIDGDTDWPTICGTGTEDYFGGAWCFEQPEGEYSKYSTAFLGLPQILRPYGPHKIQQRFGMYRWHIMDPIRFQRSIRATIQALGWHADRHDEQPRYLPLEDDISSTAFWYQAEPHVPFPAMVSTDYSTEA